MADKCRLNQRRKRGRCVKRTGVFKFFNRKTKNPFKMIGSYIGLLVAGIIFLIFAFRSMNIGIDGVPLLLKLVFFPTYIIAWLIGGGFFLDGSLNVFPGNIAWYVIIITTFLLGYVIQLIVRRIRR